MIARLHSALATARSSRGFTFSRPLNGFPVGRPRDKRYICDEPHFIVTSSEIQMHGFSLDRYDLTGFDFSDITLVNCLMRGANLEGVKFGDVSGCSFESANLRGASFTFGLGRKTRWCSFHKADLREASFNAPPVSRKYGRIHFMNFSEADLRESKFFGVCFREAEFTGANFAGSKLTQTSLEFAADCTNFRDTTLSNSTLQAQIRTKIDLSHSHFRDSSLQLLGREGIAVIEGLTMVECSKWDLLSRHISLVGVPATPF